MEKHKNGAHLLLKHKKLEKGIKRYAILLKKISLKFVRYHI